MTLGTFITGVDHEARTVQVSSSLGATWQDVTDRWQAVREELHAQAWREQMDECSIVEAIDNPAADLQFAHLVYLCAVLARVQPPVWDMAWR